MTISAAGTAELAAQECGTAWLALLTLEHPELDAPIRITSDAVTTTSNGFSFQPFPFEVTLPEDVEGGRRRRSCASTTPRRRSSALLRGLTTAPSLKIEIVRSATPNVIEREWSGLEWRSSQYDIGAITGMLTVDDLALEGVPLRHFRRPLSKGCGRDPAR